MNAGVTAGLPASVAGRIPLTAQVCAEVVQRRGSGDNTSF